MNIHEYLGAQLFRQFNIPTGGGDVAETAEQALSVAQSVGYPVVLKAQVLTGGRGKAGGVKLVHNDDELKEQFNTIINLKIKEYDVERILVVKALAIRKEFYAAVTVDNIAGDVVIIASSEGGVDIEETAKTNPDAIKKYYLQGQQVLDDARWGEFVKGVFAEETLQQQAKPIFEALLKLFFEKDCSLTEINPLVVDGEGKLIAADAKVNFDDNALYRQEEIEKLRDMKYEDPDELEAKESGLSFVKLDGSVGCIVNGAGLAMGTLDAINLLGGSPANFLDVGGSSNPAKVLKALDIILRNKNVKSILINIFGGITRCDDIANGILQAMDQIDIPVPIVIRLTGTNEKEAKELLESKGFEIYTSMRDAVAKAVEAAK